MKTHRLKTISREDAEFEIAHLTTRQLLGRHDLRNHASGHVRRKFENKLLLAAWRKFNPNAPSTVPGVIARIRSTARAVP
jgi:hypothetical protein